MENKLIEDELNYEEINDAKGLKYKLICPDAKVSEDPIIKKWLNLEKISKGDNGIVCYCKKCNLFFYFQNENDLKETKKRCCNSYYYGFICNYCGKIFFTSSLCCLKNAIKVFYEITLEEIYNNSISLYLMLFPCFSYIIFFGIFNEAPFYGRRTKVENDEFFAYEDKNTKLFQFGLIISCLSFFLFSLIYIFSFLVLYLVIIIISIKIKLSKDDKKQLYISQIRYT